MNFLNFEISKQKKVQKQLGLHLLVCTFVLQPLLLAEGGPAPQQPRVLSPVIVSPHDTVKIHRLWLAGGTYAQTQARFCPRKSWKYLLFSVVRQRGRQCMGVMHSWQLGLLSTQPAMPLSRQDH